MSEDAKREKDLDAGSRMHMLDWIESPTFLDDVRQLVAPGGITINDDAFYRPRGRHDWGESTLIGANETFLSGPQVKQLRQWWLVHHRRAPLPTWDLALAGRAADGKPALILVEAKAHSTELSDAGKKRPVRKTPAEQARSDANHAKIAQAISEASAALKISICRDKNYQFANRIAFAWKIASMGVPVVLIYLGFTGDTVISALHYLADDAAWLATFRSHVAECIPAAMIDAPIPTEKAPFWLLPRSRRAMRLSPPVGHRRRLPIAGAGRAGLHLIRPMDGSLPDVEKRLRDAHDYLACCGKTALQEACELASEGSWGCAVKREKVVLPAEGKPEAVPTELAEHSLAEVINQCATVERLLDVIAWARSDSSGLKTLHVQCCHPTTSSVGEGEEIEHDLVLVGPETIARFEISDVASSEDGNDKALKDLTRLGAFGGEAALELGASKSNRLFLAVSEEFAAGTCARWPAWRKESGLLFHVIDLCGASTKLIEILRGAAPALPSAYREAVFLASEPAGGWPKEWGIITAYNPPTVTRTTEENEYANARLRERLTAWRHFEVIGASPDLNHREPGFGVEAPLPKLLELGRAFEQAAIFWISRGAVYLYPCQPSAQRERLATWHARWRRQLSSES